MKAPARINVTCTVPDTRAVVKLNYLKSIGFRSVTAVRLMDSYVVAAGISLADLRKAATLFENPLVERATVNVPQAPAHFDWAVEIGYLPGVTDNVGTTAREMIEDFLKMKFGREDGVYSSQVIFMSGKLSRENVQALADGLYNPLIQRARIKSAAEFRKSGGMGALAPRVHLAATRGADDVDLEVGDDELTRIGKEGIKDADGSRRGPLALDLPSIHAIRDYFRGVGRDPTDLELESLAQTWSEHCKHTIFADPIDDVEKGLYRTYIKGATNAIRAVKGKKDFCVSVFSDNSGAIAFDDDYLITHKVETHNSPSALDPFGGSVTGIVGVNRDTIGFGLGAKPVANMYGFCLADPRDRTVLYRDAKKKEKMLSARRIMEGVIAGVNTGGNCSGIPTPQGFLVFDKRFRGKPLVFVGTVGLIPRKIAGRRSYEKAARPGDRVVMLGGRVGQDGIHGATFSSEAMDSGSPATAVQIGDPITQKKLSDAIVREARNMGLYSSITDNGAGGLSCSVAEMARDMRLPAGRQGGCRVELDKVPLKYPGLPPWKIWVSESQERMTLAVPKKKWKAFAALMAKRGVEATVIGEFTDSGRCVVGYRGKTVMDVGMDFLHNGLPAKHLKTRPWITPESEPLPADPDLAGSLQAMLARPNLASFEFISRQYDHEVQAGSVLKPVQGRGRVNADASAFRPVLDSPRAVVLSTGIVPSYSELDAYAMAASAIDTAIRSAVAAGAGLEHLALLDNFCWCSSNKPERLAELKQAVEACYDYAVAYGTPFISGKDSMFNDFKGYDEKGNPVSISIPPTLLISSIGVVSDAAKTVSLDLKRAGDRIYLLGETREELGGSEYAALMSEKKKQAYTGGAVPMVDAAKNKKLYRTLTSAIRKNLVASAVSVGRGGLATALARTAMAGKLGVSVSLKKIPGTVTGDTAAFFSESQGRLVVSVAPKRARDFERMMQGVSCVRIGSVSRDGVIRLRGKKHTVELPVDTALRAYRSTFKNY